MSRTLEGAARLCSGVWVGRGNVKGCRATCNSIYIELCQALRMYFLVAQVTGALIP